MLSYLRTLTTWHCPHSPTDAAIDRYLLSAGPTGANLQQRICCCGPMLGQTDGHTDDTVPFHRPCSDCYTGSANNLDNNQVAQTGRQVSNWRFFLQIPRYVSNALSRKRYNIDSYSGKLIFKITYGLSTYTNTVDLRRYWRSLNSCLNN